MKSIALLICPVAAATALAMPTLTFAACEAKSGPATAALVELYTSEGCSSCPPADRRLSQLRQSLGAKAEAVPLSLHVGYWDYIGWHDPFAQQAFEQRQRRLVALNHRQTVYTPHFFVGGTEIGLQRSALGDEVWRLNARPADAAIHVAAGPTGSGALAVDADATTIGRGTQASLYLAVTESGLVSKVARGENGGATLKHDHVVRAWVGPIPLSKGAVRAQREIALDPTWNRAQLDLVAFVEDDRTGAVLQAVNAGRHCPD
ncbi:MAG TPA: DUF1223 domain-containing protein [Casimicrobiaceae bacterium]|nr:DUF1223 domain-containing protein [Casimicrobiaceae bacterium]